MGPHNPDQRTMASAGGQNRDKHIFVIGARKKKNLVEIRKNNRKFYAGDLDLVLIVSP